MTEDLTEVVLAGRGLTAADIVRVARGGARVAIDPGVAARLAEARRAVDRLAGGDTPVYGLTTGLGANVGARLDKDDLSAYQRRAVRARAVGMGSPLPKEVVRAMMAARAAGLAVGGSGARPAVLEALVAALNAGLTPWVPSLGSIGAGDLAPLAHMALSLIGEGAAEVDGGLLIGLSALEAVGLAPLDLGPKDGLALISSNALTVGLGVLTLADADCALDVLDAAVALSLEGFRGNLSVLDPRVQQVRPAPGQVETAARLSRLLHGSSLWQPGAARRVQDPLSFRCAASVHGAVLWALGEARRAVEIELNGAGDSPLVLGDDMVSTANFHIPQLALAFEALGLGLAQAAQASVERIKRMMSPPMTGLPMQLAPHAPSHSGFGTLQKTAVHLFAEIRRLAQPALLDGSAVSEAAEDHAPMAPSIVAKTAALIAHVQRLAAIELMVAAQAVDLRHPLQLGAGTRIAYDLVRSIVPYLDEDGPTGPNAERLSEALRSGGLRIPDALGDRYALR